MKTELPEQPATFTEPQAENTRADVIEMAPLVMHLKNILVPLDFSEMAMKALDYAVPFARQFGAKLTLLHVVQPPAYTPELPYPAALEPNESTAIEQQLAELREKRIPAEIATDVVVRHNFVFDGILEVALATKADLIITSTHGYTGLKHLFIGSTAESIVRRAPCPVLVVREREHDFV